ncbi:MAG: HU family DNA-binding protein [Deltaproteobacteria bacterium]
MKRSELERELAAKFNLQPKQSEQIIDTIIDHMTQVLQEGERIEIRGFGSFFTKNYKPYTGRNPRTGEVVEVSTKKLPHFRPSKELITKLNGEDGDS